MASSVWGAATFLWSLHRAEIPLTDNCEVTGHMGWHNEFDISPLNAN